LEIENVLYSGYIYEGTTGAWKKQLNEMSDKSYLVEVYWVAWIGEVGKSDEYEKSFTELNEAETFYQNLKTIAQARKKMNKGAM
jgi:hypothetical protein